MYRRNCHLLIDFTQKVCYGCGEQDMYAVCTTLFHVLSYNWYYFSDLLIKKADSTRVAESWVGRKITVVCAVKVPESIQQNVMFSWMHIPSNRTVPREFHDDMRSKSFLTETTNKDEDFEALQCKAETKSTVKFHIINITKLSKCYLVISTELKM